MPPSFWSEKYENSQQEVFNIFLFLGGHGPDCSQSRINFTKINQNYDCFQKILEQPIDEINQK